MTSPENPFGPPAATGDPDLVNEDHEFGMENDRFDSTHRHTYGGKIKRTDLASASPESGLVKVSMYSMLQEEIKNDARRKSDQVCGGK